MSNIRLERQNTEKQGDFQKKEHPDRQRNIDHALLWIEILTKPPFRVIMHEQCLIISLHPRNNSRMGNIATPLEFNMSQNDFKRDLSCLSRKYFLMHWNNREHF